MSVTTQVPSAGELLRCYLSAKRAVVDGGFADEIAWQATRNHAELSPTTFAREAAWVVLSSGMRESVISGLFVPLVNALRDFDPIALMANRHEARTDALRVLRHEGKIDAIIYIAEEGRRMGRAALREAVRKEPEQFLRSLPYIGPVTWRHLAKNLGVPVAKPDRHLVRIARATSRASVGALCDEIASWSGDPVPVVDIVLWRWSVLHSRDCHATCTAGLHESRT